MPDDQQPKDSSSDWDCILRPEKDLDLIPDCHRIASGYGQFCLNTAHQLAQLSHLVYVRDPERRGQLADHIGMRETASFTSWGLHWSRFDSRDSADGPTVLCFRGSSDPRHWIFNIGALLVDWPRGGKVHMGFEQAYRKLKDTLHQKLEKQSINHLIMTGHSLGAALAQLAASDLSLPCHSVYTFGSPRPGNRDFRDGLEERCRIHRIVHGHDFVTQLPQHWKHLNQLAFVHPGLPVRITGDGNLDAGSDANLPTPEEMLQQSLQAITTASTFVNPVPALLDHAPIRYVRVLRQCRNRTREIDEGHST